MSTAPTKKPALGVIVADEWYTAFELRRRCGWGAAAFRAARKAGLRVKRFGNSRFVSGADMISFLERSAVDDGAAHVPPDPL